jgi:Na+/H+ antiporter NhaD/arsenite permease-like protein
MAEESIYADDNVSITTARIVVSGTTYALRNITSVRMTDTNPSKIGPIVCLILGLIILAMGLVAFTQSAGEGFMFSLAGAPLAGAGLYTLWTARRSYSVTIASSAGEIRALTSPDKQYISKIVASVNEAIVRYR